MASHGGARRYQREAADLTPIHIQTAVTAAIVACAVAALMLRAGGRWRSCCWRAGAAAAFVLARERDDNPLWHAGGVLYLGLPSLALVALRDFAPHGALWCWRLFLVVWATDTGALVFGNLIGGPKLAPRLSPNKTWAGTIGGIVTAAVVFAALYRVLGGFDVWLAMLFGFVLQSSPPMAATCSSPWSSGASATRTRGGLIPGHGGVLDRIDSTVRGQRVPGDSDIRAASQPAIRSACMKPLAATRTFDELPPLERCAGAQRHGAGLDRLHRRQHARCDRPCAQSLRRRCVADRRR